MSCTVMAVPLALYWVAHSMIVGTHIAGDLLGLAADRLKNKDNEDFLLIEDDKETNCNNDSSHSITMSHFIEKEFETPFTDKEILKKTLEEHGVTGLEFYENSLSCKFEQYILSFTKYEGKENYSLKISCADEDSADEKANDLLSEYSLNVQEDAYLHILQKLKENNLQVEEETVEDDNTIVLTINID